MQASTDSTGVQHESLEKQAEEQHSKMDDINRQNSRLLGKEKQAKAAEDASQRRSKKAAKAIENEKATAEGRQSNNERLLPRTRWLMYASRSAWPRGRPQGCRKPAG
jgi:peptidoglycan hydrolase CwlO-like protein